MLEKISKAACLILLFAVSGTSASAGDDDDFSEFMIMPGGGPAMKNPAALREPPEPASGEPSNKGWKGLPDLDLNGDGVIDPKELALATKKSQQEPPLKDENENFRGS